ncbi:MAG: hypothetical protein ABUK01_18620 [Leptospirales bacterium]
MVNYSLNIEFDNKGLGKIRAAGELVVITKTVNSGGASAPVAWVTFQPSQQNAVKWSENYQIYASNSKVQNGAQIVEVSNVKAAAGNSYPFLNSNSFGATTSSGDPAKYTIANQDMKKASLTFGLAQDATVNGTQSVNPINAVSLPSNQTAVFTPIETIQVFTMANIMGSTVIDRVNSNALTVDLTSAASQNIKYDDNLNCFVMA